ncbi:MAG: hypothetical protein KDI71_22420, partial [Xanthomonadales bacterium]|nr:hypothetical protein [Xanthomonadales bacterium]
MRWILVLTFALSAAAPAVAGSLPAVCDQLFNAGFEDAATTPPLSNAGPDRLALRGSQVDLDGSASSGSGYCWEMLSRPADSGASLSDPLSATPSFVADQAGDYLLRLTAFEGMLAGPSDLLLVSTRAVQAAVDPADGEQLVSADYGLTLDVAANALSGTTNIGIDVLVEAAVPAVLAQAGADVVYELGPDGQSFSSPVDLAWRQPRGAQIAPRVLAHESNGAVELADSVHQVGPNGELIAGQVGHFSRIAPIVVPFLRLDIDRFLIAGVGQRFSIGYGGSAVGAPDGFSASTRKEGAYSAAPVVLGPATLPPVVEDLAYDEDLNI